MPHSWERPGLRLSTFFVDADCHTVKKIPVGPTLAVELSVYFLGASLAALVMSTCWPTRKHNRLRFAPKTSETNTYMYLCMWVPVLGFLVGLPCASRVYMYTSGCHTALYARFTNYIPPMLSTHIRCWLSYLSFCARLVVKGCSPFSEPETTIDYLWRDSAENHKV